MSDIIKAYINNDGVSVDERKICVEIYKWSTDEVDYEWYEREIDAVARVNYINSLETTFWSDL